MLFLSGDFTRFVLIFVGGENSPIEPDWLPLSLNFSLFCCSCLSFCILWYLKTGSFFFLVVIFLRLKLLKLFRLIFLKIFSDDYWFLALSVDFYAIILSYEFPVFNRGLFCVSADGDFVLLKFPGYCWVNTFYVKFYADIFLAIYDTSVFCVESYFLWKDGFVLVAELVLIFYISFSISWF